MAPAGLLRPGDATLSVGELLGSGLRRAPVRPTQEDPEAHFAAKPAGVLTLQQLERCRIGRHDAIPTETALGCDPNHLVAGTCDFVMGCRRVVAWRMSFG